MFAEKPRHAQIEFAVERCSVEARRHVGAKARYGGRELRRARCQESEMASRHDMNVGRSGKAAGDASHTRWIDTLASQFRSPELQRNLDGGQIVLGEEPAWRVGDHCGPDARIMWRAGSFAAP